MILFRVFLLSFFSYTCLATENIEEKTELVLKVSFRKKLKIRQMSVVDLARKGRQKTQKCCRLTYRTNLRDEKQPIQS